MPVEMQTFIVFAAYWIALGILAIFLIAVFAVLVQK